MKFHVEPASGDVKVPPHPFEGPMPPEGAYWLADQYTLRLLADEVIRRKDGDTDEAALERMQPRQPDAPAQDASTSAPATQQSRRALPVRTDPEA